MSMAEIAIDACVFRHLLDPAWNIESIIDNVLLRLIQEKYILLTDSAGKIDKDYMDQVVPAIKNNFDTDNRRILLRHWMMLAERKVIKLDQTDRLMSAIKEVIVEDELADRAFVYVAFKNDSILVSDDHKHILGRRKKLLKSTKKYRGGNANILSSSDAHTHYCRPGVSE